MPDISAALDRAVLLIICRYLNTVEDTLGSGDLIRTHNHQHILRGKNAIPCEDIQNGVLGKKGLCKVDQIGNYAVVRVSPKRCELKAVRCLALFLG